MKKQLLIAAVAATMSATAIADISITGDAEFYYQNTDMKIGGVKSSTNKTSTEVNLNVRGKNGATEVVADLELGSWGSTKVANVLEVENLYMTTKLGPVSAKLGNYTSSTSGILGEIENGDRKDGKMTLSYTTNGIKFYAGNNGTKDNDTEIDNNMFAGVVSTVEGWKLELKKNNGDKTSFGVAGKAGPVGIRVEFASSDKKSDNGFFANFTTKMDNINLGLAMISMSKDAGVDGKGITEDDSAIFAVENGLKLGGNTTAIGGSANSQLSASINVDGTTYGAKIGSIGFDATGVKDVDYTQLYAERALASGVTTKVTYTDLDNGSDEGKSFEVKLNVKF